MWMMFKHGIDDAPLYCNIIGRLLLKVGLSLTTPVVSYRDGVPIYQYRTDPDASPVSVHRHLGEVGERGRHIHDFPALWYVSASGLVYVAAAGEVLDPGQMDNLDAGVGVFFDPAALGEDARSPWPAWRAHPLLFPFLHGQSGGVLRLEVPASRRPMWDNAISSIETELTTRQEGYRQAALAHLTLLLIELARLARDVVADLRRSGEPLLADVFSVIDRRHAERVVAARRGARDRHDAGTSHHRRAPPHRAHGAGVDHRTPNGRSAHHAGRDRSSGRRDRQAGRGYRPRLFQPAVHPDARHLAAQVARSAEPVAAAHNSDPQSALGSGDG